MVHNFGIDTSRWLSLVVVLHTAWTVTSVILPTSPGLSDLCSVFPGGRALPQTAKQHLTLVFGHKVNDNSTYCGVWNLRFGYFSSLHASLQGWLFRFRGGWMREMCLGFGSWMALNWGGISLKYSQNNHPVWVCSLNVVSVCECVCRWYVWGGVINDHSLNSLLHALLQIFNRVHSSEVKAGADRWRALFSENPGRLATRVWSWGRLRPRRFPLRIEQSVYGEACGTLIAALSSSPGRECLWRQEAIR